MTGLASRWIQRLARCATLSLEEQRVLEDATESPRRCSSSENLVKVGDPADRLIVILSGHAYQYRLLPDGRRQILAYLFAGDMCDPRQLMLPQVDYSMCVLASSDIATLSVNTLQRLERHPNVSLAMARYALMQAAITREWLVNVGHRTAFERIGHLVCEMFTRLESVGLTHEHAFELPLTQAELGDTLALSAVHVNRTLMELRRLKLVTFQNRQVVIHDFNALQSAAGFDPSYLHFNERSPERAMSAL